MVRNYLTIESISQCHETDGDIIQHVFIDIRKRGTDYRLLAIFTIVIALDARHT